MSLLAPLPLRGGLTRIEDAFAAPRAQLAIVGADPVEVVVLAAVLFFLFNILVFYIDLSIIVVLR